MRILRSMCAVVFLAAATCPALAEPFAKPDEIRFGASAADMHIALKGKCKTENLRPIDPPFLPDVKDKQVQIDCDGYVFMGKPRWAEFVIGDDRLQMVWIMTGKDEDGTLYNAMIAAYGTPSYRGKDYDMFQTHRAALRRDKHEILFYAPEHDEGMAKMTKSD